MKRLVLCMAICWCGTVVAATCKPGYYLENGECKECSPNHEPFYCPGDDTRHPCPTTNTDYEKLSGWTKTSGREATYAYTNANGRACYGYMDFKDSYGNQVVVECPFNGENYWCDKRLWYAAGPGFYLSDYSWTSSADWYSYIRECTNAPTNAHYTGAGTPDAKDGSVIDANDCPWACDTGFGRSASGECLPLCSGGATIIRANSVSAPLFNEKHTSPALAVGLGDRVCYADLVLGSARPAINISYGGQIYHTVNE